MAGKEERRKIDPKTRAWLKRTGFLYPSQPALQAQAGGNETACRIRTGKSVLIAILGTPPENTLSDHLSRLTSGRSYMHGTADVISERTWQTEYVCKLAGA